MKTLACPTLFVALCLVLSACGSDGSSDADGESTTETTVADATASGEDPSDQQDAGNRLSITSSAFADAGPIPAEYTCDGANVQPPLEITGTPAEATSLVLIVDDPDAPNGSFIHWVVWNLEPDASIPQGSLPNGAIEGTNGTSNTAWFGPCPPPDGPHNYEFQLSAVSAEPDVDPGATAEEVRAAIADTTVATTTLVGVFERS